MVKAKKIFVIKIDLPRKRFRGLKTNIKKGYLKKIKPKMPHEAKRNKIISDRLNFTPENRYFALVGLWQLLKQINQQCPLPENFMFSAIALFDKYLTKSENFLNRIEINKALFACLDILDKEQNINIFCDSYFKDYIDYEVEYDILETIDLEIYPEKLYDHFGKLYFKLIQSQNKNKVSRHFINIFKKIFFKIAFLILFHIETINKKPSINFVYCLLLTYEKISELMPIESSFLSNFIKEFKILYKYSEYKYFYFKNLLERSYNIFNSLNKLC